MRILLTIISMFLIAACSQSLPAPGEVDKTVLVIPMEGYRDTGFTYQYEVDYEISQCTGAESKEKVYDSTIRARDGLTYVIVSDLPPGNCMLTKTIQHKYASRAKRNRHMRYSGHLLDFDLEDGKITIFPRLLEISQANTAKKKFRFGYSIERLSPQNKQKVISKLKLDSNFSKWQILEER